MGSEKLNRMKKRTAAWIVWTVVAVSFNQLAHAHPHGWIDLTVKVNFDSAGRVTALSQTWLFDDLYSAFVLEEAGAHPGDNVEQAVIDRIVNENLTNLAEFSYFTEIEKDDVKLSFGIISDVEGGIEDGRLKMTFTLALETPQFPGPDGLQYAVYDPSFFIEMLHLESDDAIQLSGSNGDCAIQKIAPNPDEATVTFAAMLDQSQSAGGNLGVHFAEKVIIRCGEAR